MALDKERITYKPFEYPWAYHYWKKQQQVHWLPEEVPLGDDVRDYKSRLTNAERNLITQIFRFFTQSDIEIGNCYHKHYMKHFKPLEVQMMLTAFGNMETIHVDAYSHLLDTLGLPETEYEAFLEYKEMKDKFDWLRSFHPDDPMSVAESLAAFSGATEGMSLFASFAILLNFPRHNKMMGMGDIISWSVRDESMHCEGIAKLFHTYVEEKKDEINRFELSRRIRVVFEQAVLNEEKFIDLVFEMGPVEGLSAFEMKQYIRYIADMRLQQLGEAPIYNITKNPLPWLVSMLNGVEFGNFFETRVTEYSKGATTGDWDDAYDG
jgi:ribonucleoside-diphosphate reductase beta chain